MSISTAVNIFDVLLPIEAESDQEPTSTVENAAATVWSGCINMVDVARFYVAAHEVLHLIHLSLNIDNNSLVIC